VVAVEQEKESLAVGRPQKIRAVDEITDLVGVEIIAGGNGIAMGVPNYQPLFAGGIQGGNPAAIRRRRRFGVLVFRAVTGHVFAAVRLHLAQDGGRSSP